MFHTMSVGSVISGIGLVGLGIYQLTQGEVNSAIQSILAGLTSFGLSIGLQSHQALKEQLNRKGMI